MLPTHERDMCIDANQWLCMCIDRSTYLSSKSSMHPSINPSIPTGIYLCHAAISIDLSICLSIYLSIILPMYPTMDVKPTPAPLRTHAYMYHAYRQEGQTGRQAGRQPDRSYRYWFRSVWRSHVTGLVQVCRKLSFIRSSAFSVCARLTSPSAK